MKLLWATKNIFIKEICLEYYIFLNFFIAVFSLVPLSFSSWFFGWHVTQICECFFVEVVSQIAKRIYAKISIIDDHWTNPFRLLDCFVNTLQEQYGGNDHHYQKVLRVNSKQEQSHNVTDDYENVKFSVWVSLGLRTVACINHAIIKLRLFAFFNFPFCSKGWELIHYVHHCGFLSRKLCLGTLSYFFVLIFPSVAFSKLHKE